MNREDKLIVTVGTLKQIATLNIEGTKELLDGRKVNRLFLEGMLEAEEKNLRTLNTLFPGVE